MAVKEKKQILDEDGQAIFELILFLPFLVYFVSLLFTSGNAINGSINQQKATRGYFYHIVKGNSMLPEQSDLNASKAESLEAISAFSIGWAESRTEDGSEQYGTCYKYSTLYSSSDEVCEEKAQEETSSIFVKPLTFYGVCSTTYILRNEEYIFDPIMSAQYNCRLGGVGN